MSVEKNKFLWRWMKVSDKGGELVYFEDFTAKETVLVTGYFVGSDNI